MASWLARLSGKSSSEEDEEPATVAHMGGANTMYYDEQRKRWVERGKEDELEEDEELKPPPMAFTKRETPAADPSTSSSSSNDFMAQMTRPVALGAARSRFVDPFTSMSGGSTAKSTSPKKGPPHLLPAPNPFGGLLPGPPVLTEEKPSGEEEEGTAVSMPIPPESTKELTTSPVLPESVEAETKQEEEQPVDTAVTDALPMRSAVEDERQVESSQTPLAATGQLDGGEMEESPIPKQSVLPPSPPVSNGIGTSPLSTPGGSSVEEMQESKIEEEKSTAEEVWEAPTWGQEPVSTPTVELDYDDLLGESAWTTEERRVGVEDAGVLREREAEVPESPAVFSSEKAAASASPLKSVSPVGVGLGEDVGWGGLLSHDEWGEQGGDWMVVTPTEQEEGCTHTDDTTQRDDGSGDPPSPTLPIETRVGSPKEGGVVPVVEVHHDDDEEEEVVAASPEGGEEESPVVERDEVSEDQGIVEEAVEEKAGVDEQGEGVLTGSEEPKRSTSIDFFEEILGEKAAESDEKPDTNDGGEEHEPSPAVEAPSPALVPSSSSSLPPKAPSRGSSEGGRRKSSMSSGDLGESIEEHPTAAVPHVAETASIVATRAPWGREEEEEDSRRQRSMSADLLLLPHIGSSHEGGALRPPPSPVHSPLPSLDRPYRARIVDHSRRIQSLEERMSEGSQAFEKLSKESSETIARLEAKLEEVTTVLETQKEANAELRGRVKDQQRQLEELVKKTAEEEVSKAAPADGEEDVEGILKDLPDFVRTRDREDILLFVQNLIKAKTKEEEAMYQSSRLESTGSVYSQRSRTLMPGGRNGRQYRQQQQQLDSSSPASSISRTQRTSTSRVVKSSRSKAYGCQGYTPARSFHRLMEEYGSDDDDENTIMHSPAEAATSRLDLDDSRLSEINSSTGLVARLEYLSSHCRYAVPSCSSREEAEAARTTLEEVAASSDAMVASAFAKTMEVVSFSWDSSALPRNPLLTKATIFKAFSCMPEKLEELLKSSTRCPLSVEMQQEVRAMLGAMWNISLNEDSHDNPILTGGSALLPSLVQVLARYSVDDRQICKNACGLLLTLMTNDSKLCRDFLAVDGGLSVLTSVLRTHKFEQEDAATEQALQCIFLLATVVPECRASIGSQIDRFTLDRLQGIKHASRLRDILFRSSTRNNKR